MATMQTKKDERRTPRRRFNAALAAGWGLLAFCGATFVAMVQDFLGPKALKEPRKVWRVGKVEEFAAPGTVDERFKRTPDGGTGFWVVNLSPREEKLVALSTVCTHLGCIPDWQGGERRFKCPCHGSGFYADGVNFEGPAPRPLERFGIRKDAEGYIVVDQGQVYREELGEWEKAESFVELG